MPRRRSRRVVTRLCIRGGFRRPQEYVLGCRGWVALVGRAPLPILPLFNGDGRHSRSCCLVQALELVCSQRVQNFWKAETSKHSATKRKPTCSLSLCLPDSGLLQNQTTSTRQSARLLSLVFQPFGPPPPLVWHLLSVCVRWGGDPSSVVNIYNPNYSSHPTQQQRHAVGRLRVGAKHERHACVSRRKP